jgi:hypothetical protein
VVWIPAGSLELANGAIQPDSVGGEEGMGLVAVQLPALIFVDGVLDRQRVQPALNGEASSVMTRACVVERKLPVGVV